MTPKKKTKSKQSSKLKSKSKSKSTKSKPTTGGKRKPAKKSARTVAAKQPANQKQPAKKKKKIAPNRAVASGKVAKKQMSRGPRAATPLKPTQRRSRIRPDLTSSSEMLGPGSGGQSGDLQGLSYVADADSESVEELIEEGNSFEAGVVRGVEDAGERGVREVRTREVPEDDVPEEYLDKD
jgi:hypothetical protein